MKITKYLEFNTIYRFSVSYNKYHARYISCDITGLQDIALNTGLLAVLVPYNSVSLLGEVICELFMNIILRYSHPRAETAAFLRSSTHLGLAFSLTGWHSYQETAEKLRHRCEEPPDASLGACTVLQIVYPYLAWWTSKNKQITYPTVRVTGAGFVKTCNFVKFYFRML